MTSTRHSLTSCAHLSAEWALFGTLYHVFMRIVCLREAAKKSFFKVAKNVVTKLEGGGALKKIFSTSLTFNNLIKELWWIPLASYFQWITWKPLLCTTLGYLESDLKKSGSNSELNIHAQKNRDGTGPLVQDRDGPDIELAGYPSIFPHNCLWANYK